MGSRMGAGILRKGFVLLMYTMHGFGVGRTCSNGKRYESTGKEQCESSSSRLWQAC